MNNLIRERMETKFSLKPKLEKHPFYIRLLRIFVVPILNVIPAKFLQNFIRKTSPYGKRVLERPGSTHSLENMYTKGPAKVMDRSNIADFFWHNVISQPKAIRNRLKIVEHILEEEIRHLANEKKEIQICNLGGGSSRAIIQTVSKISNEISSKIIVTCIDKDATALELGRVIAKEYNVGHLFNWILADARNLSQHVSENSIDIVEMVGLLDYFNEEQATKLIAQIYTVLKSPGTFIVANIHPNSESKFVKNVGWPEMQYRTSEDLSKVLTRAGFSEEYFSLIFEPLKIHLIGIARKN